MNSIIKKIFTVLLITVLFTQGCSENDVIDLYPEFSLDALSNPSTLDQVQEVLLGSYAGFREANYYGAGSGTGSGWALMPDVLSDNLYETANESLANSRVMAEWTYLPNTGQITTMYTAPYAVIAAANIVLRDVDKFATASNGLRINRIKGQAHAIRAMAHFDLFRYFAYTYDRNSTEDLAVFYNKTFVVSTVQKPARTTNSEFYTALVDDLTQAATLLNNVDQNINTAANVRPFIDLVGVYALQARVYLYAELWPEAETAASNAIALRPLVNLNQSAYSGMYNETNLGEIIWNVQFDAGQGGPTTLVYFANSNRNYFRPSYDIAVLDGDEGLIQSNDIRYSAFFKPATAGSPGLSIKKYQGKTALDNNANFVALKTGEMYLIRAEARARNSKENLALDDLNHLRSARINGYVDEVGLTGGALLTAIADERRRELFAEGHRFFDAKRTTRTMQRGAPCGTLSVSPIGKCSLSPTDKEWALPIPESVINANSNMEQNPDY